MALWGNKDSKTASGTVSIDNTGAVTGSSTAFTTETKVGNYIKAGGLDYQIVSITDDTTAKVIMGKNNGNGTVTTATSASYTLSEKPVYVAHESADGGFGALGDSNKVFGVDTSEVFQGSNDVVEVAVVNAGTGYLETPNVTFASGSQTATATISGGSLTKVTITGSGAYASVPTVYIDVPKRTIPTAGVNTGTEVITYTGHGISTGQRIRYNNAGSTTLTGLTSGTTYYAIVTGANTFKVASSADNATAGTAINLTGTGNNSQFFDLLDETTATVQAALGSGDGGTQVAHSGWVRRTVGTGGRAGRIFYETLVANGSISGDQNDDVQFPDN
jgi:hypothetical protein